MTTFTIKITALLTMIADHTGFVFGFSTLRYVGRIAFPLYAFLIGEGCRHTRDIKKYLSRLLIFALISEIPFDLMRSAALRQRVSPASFSDLIDLSAQNIFFTLFLGASAIAVYLWAKDRLGGIAALFAGLAVMVLFAYTADFIRSDYGFMGVIIIAAPFIAGDTLKHQKAGNFVRILATVLCLAGIYISFPRAPQFNFFIAALVSLPFILLYGGRKGRPVKWAFYLAYPLHMVILVILWLYL